MSCYQVEISCHLHAASLKDAIALLGEVNSALSHCLTDGLMRSSDTSDTGFEGNLIVNQVHEEEGEAELQPVASIAFTFVLTDSEDALFTSSPLPGHGTIGRN